MKRFCDQARLVLGAYDLRSMQEMVKKHVDLLNVGQCKYTRTTDTQTLNIANDILKNNQFLRDNVLGIQNQSTSEVESLAVRLCNLRKHPEIMAQYNKWKESGKDRVVAIGGPAATDQTMISGMIPAIKDTHDIHYYCRNYKESNLLHSASQSHARHGNALNADPVLSGRNLLPLVMKRMLFKTSYEEVTRSDFVKVDVKLNNPRYYLPYLKNQINGIVQIIKGKLGMFTEHDLNRLQSVVSQEIQKVMEKDLNMKFRSNKKTDKEKSMAIHLIFSEESLAEIKKEQKQFENLKELKWSELTKDQITELFPRSEGILTAFRYHGDYHNMFDLYDSEKKKSSQFGAVWEEDKTLSSVYLDLNESGQPIVCGVSFSDGIFVPTNKLHLTLGYKARYEFENSRIKPLTSFNMPATGLSMTMLFRMTPELKNILKEKEGAMEIAIINSHWTIIAHNEDYLLVRSTAGGNTGSQNYMPSYFLNLCANTKRIFGDAFVGIVSAYGCSRGVNYKNSTQFGKIAQNFVISYGKGGTGNTKRASEAYKALKYLGFQNELSSYFGQKEVDRVHISKTLDMICEQSAKTDLFYSNMKATKKFLLS